MKRHLVLSDAAFTEHETREHGCAAWPTEEVDAAQPPRTLQSG